ncbi:hypothetical protein [Rathayibacter sp. VKM Ac-2760]|uniref:hypothetical protein n=1 Tax=Rathayibacter sp. VKM Ac-2760 TaxID=2609253 RepID=UPI0013179447|nr:hypothetical protein [Rathayibacter sp. VKM Ac-2760]QHC58621.1 hypothetical protein GSU72_08715 [Rathayibacter sp. VKM Ac-2760]
MSSSSAAYRRALRWYPAAWRERNGESAISAYLDRDDATGVTGPTRSDRANLARAGIRETFVATIRRPRLATTAIGALFLLAAWTLTAVILEYGERALLVLITGVVNFDSRTSTGPVLIATALVALAWLSAAGVALRRGRQLPALAIALCGLASTGTFCVLWWSGPFTPLHFQAHPIPLIVLSIVAISAPIAATAAAVRAGVLERRAQGFVAAGAAAHVLGVVALSPMDPPWTIAGVVVSVVLMLLSPAAIVVLGASFAFLSRTDRSLPLSLRRTDQLSRR